MSEIKVCAGPRVPWSLGGRVLPVSFSIWWLHSFLDSWQRHSILGLHFHMVIFPPPSMSVLFYF